MRVLAFSLCLWLLVSGQAVAHPCATGQSTIGMIRVLHPSLGLKVEGSDQQYFLAGVLEDNARFDLSPALSEMIDQPAVLYFADGSADRYGRVPVQLFQKDRWLQGELLEQGKTVVFGIGVLAKCLAELRRFEKKAEAASIGVWGNKGDKQVQISADDLANLSARAGEFVLVKGKIRSIGNRSRQLYLNFGQKWSQDFTVSVVKKGSGAFKGNAEGLAGLKNKTVRVRGILENRQGPLIRLRDEAQIEILD